MAHAASLKTFGLVTPRAELTPCILDDDPAQLELRAAQVLGIGRTSLYRYLKEGGYDQSVIARAKAAGQ